MEGSFGAETMLVIQQANVNAIRRLDHSCMRCPFRPSAFLSVDRVLRVCNKNRYGIDHDTLLLLQYNVDWLNS
jgi:hypothetical protein